MSKLTFLGAAGTVTGSKYLVEAAGKRLLVDCGIFQGTPELSDRNYKPLPTDPKTIDYAVLTHAHLDHTGLLPRLVRDVYSHTISNPPPSTPPTTTVPRRRPPEHNPDPAPEAPADLPPAIVNRSPKRDNSFVTPSPAIGRTQTFKSYPPQLEDQQPIPRLPVY